MTVPVPATCPCCSGGAILFNYTTGGMVGSSPRLSEDETMLFAGCKDGQLYALAL